MIFGNEPLRLWISAVTGASLFPADYPIELREYGPQSEGMVCHKDREMYETSLEVVVSIKHHGRSTVTWFDAADNARTIRPHANSITLVKPNSAVHCVGASRGGSRSILKFIFVGNYRKGADFDKFTPTMCTDDHPDPAQVSGRVIESGLSEL